MDKFDLLDRKILYELDCNGRATYSQVAKATRSSKTTVKYRVERLIKENVISGFHTVIDFSPIGYMIYRFCIRLRKCPQTIENEIIKYLLNDEQIYVVFKVDGPYHLVFAVKSKNAWELKKFWEEFNEKFFEYIQSNHMSIILDYWEFTRTYLLPTPREKKQFITLKKPDALLIDDTDKQILDYISYNARASLIEIADKIGKSTMVVRHRIKNLEKKKIILGYRAVLNYEKIGYYYYKVDLSLATIRNLPKIRQHILSHPNVVYIEKSLTTADFEFDLEVRNFIEFTSIMDSFKSKFPEDILDYNYYSLVKGYKIF